MALKLPRLAKDVAVSFGPIQNYMALKLTSSGLLLI